KNNFICDDYFRYKPINKNRFSTVLIFINKYERWWKIIDITNSLIKNGNLYIIFFCYEFDFLQKGIFKKLPFWFLGLKYRVNIPDSKMFIVEGKK
ncbi:hypothetical protein JXB31_02250, partial [Candidatus Woesearchaeota archaeon]|nr:hypothetical protein [Candidatus Woesearchaeota archaeon]